MKRLAYVFIGLFFVFCLTGTPILQKTDMIQAKAENVAAKGNNNTNGYEYRQGDLVYRRYKNGIKLEKGAGFYIPEPNIKLQDGSKVSIWVNSLETNENQKIMDYTYPREISFTADKLGTYVIYALIESKDSSSYLDLTKRGLIRANADKNSTNGIIPLR